MKKFLLILLALALILAGIAVWFWHSMGFTDVARLVPANTVALVSLPDLPRSAFRWPRTILSQITAEPDVRAFFEKPLAQLSGDQGGGEAADILLRLKPTCLFAAATNISSREYSVLIGFQFWGGGHDYDSAVARLRQELERDIPSPAAPQVEAYHGAQILSSVWRGGILYSARNGHWGFVSNDLATIRQALDRSSGRVKNDSLADNQTFRESRPRLVKDPDVFVFVQTPPILDALLSAGASLGARPIPAQVEQARKVEAIAAALKFDGPNLHDSLFVLRRDPPDIGSLSHKAGRVVSRDTVLYFDFLADFRQLLAWNSDPALPALPQLAALRSSPLPALLPEALGPECAVALTWREGDFKPGALLAIEVRDPAKATEAFQQFLSLFPQAMMTELSGARLYNVPSLQGFLVNPTFAVTDGFILAGLDVSDIERALATLRGSDSLEKSPEFAPALPAYRKANEVFGYIDSRTVFSRSYPMLRQVMIFGAAVMPDVMNFIDASKLPETASIARHLKPITYSQTRFRDGYLIESEGPITMSQAILTTAAVASPFLKPSSNP